jgi:putative peptidoglycan lipid II flippase
MAQCLVQLPILYRLGFRYRWHWHWQDSGLKAVRCLLLPALLGSAAVQINVFINSNFASYLGDKAISWLNYAFRLIQFPIGLFGVSLVSAWLPTLNRAYTKADFPHFYRSFSEGMQLVCFFSLPAACGLAICSEPMVRLIYEHGRFTTMDTYATASAVMAYGLGLPGYAALKLLQPSFMTIGLAYQPMLVSIVAQILNFSVNLYWVGYGNGGHTALALTTSLLAIFSALWLTVLFLRDSRKRLKADDCVHRALMGQCMRMMVASLAMSIGCFYTYSWMQHHGFAHSSVSAFWELMVLVPMGFVLYLFVGIMVRVRIGLRLIGFQ